MDRQSPYAQTMKELYMTFNQFCQNVCQLLKIASVFTSSYNPQIMGQIDRYNRTLTGMLRYNANDHQQN